jgi:hypothetical protein
MSVRYVLAPEAALDLVQIWRYTGKQGSFQSHRVRVSYVTSSSVIP